MKRYGAVIGVHPDRLETYRALHAEVWPSVVAAIRRAQIRNFVIYLREPENLLFQSFDYIGEDFASDMALMDQDPDVQRWYRQTDACQIPLESLGSEGRWAPMETLFELDAINVKVGGPD